MALESTFDVRRAVEWYSAASLRTMLRGRHAYREGLRSKAECIAALHDCLLDPDSIRRAIASLGPLPQEALELLKRRGGEMPVAAMRGQLAVWYPDLGLTEVERAPVELARCALAFWGAPAPRGAVSSLHDVQRPAADNPLSVVIFSAPEILDHVPETSHASQVSLHPGGPIAQPVMTGQFQHRLLDFLRVIESRAPRVLQSGLIGVRDRAALAHALEITDPEATRASDRRTRNRHDGPVNFFRALLGALGVVEISSERQLRTSIDAPRFAGLAPIQQARQLLDAWLEIGENELFSLPHLHCERRAHVASVVPGAERVQRAHRQLIETIRQQVRPGFWYRLGDLSRAVRFADVEFLISWRDPTPYRWSVYSFDHQRALAPPYVGISLEDSRGRSRSLEMGIDWDLVEGAFIRAVLRGPLTWLGLIAGVEVEEDDCFTLTDLGAQVLDITGGAQPVASEPSLRHPDALIVQPNFEVLVYEPEQRHDLLYQVDRFAERVSLDRIAIYRITRDSFCAGLQLGSQLSDALALLEGSARAPIPQNVAFTLGDWARSFEEVRWYRNAWLVEAPDAPTLDHWLTDPDLAAALDRRIAPTLALFGSARPAGLGANLAARSGVAVTVVNGDAPLAPCLHLEGVTTLRSDPGGPNLYVRSRLDAFAERLPEDPRGECYQITQESVGQAARNGLEPSEILHTLTVLIGQRLPGGLSLRIKGWAGAHPPLGLGLVAILTAPDPEILREVWDDPTLSRGLIANLPPNAVIVRLDALEKLRSVLATYGIPTTEYRPPARRDAATSQIQDGPIRER